MTTLGFFTEEDSLNRAATHLWNHLRTGGQQPIVGTVFLYNETREDVVDMTMDDFVYIFDFIEKGCSTCGKDYTMCKSWHKK
jgi:hypothetical protein